MKYLTLNIKEQNLQIKFDRIRITHYILRVKNNHLITKAQLQ